MPDQVKPRSRPPTRRRPTAALPEAAAHHRRSRQQNRSETAEDYVEAIAELIEAEGEARAVAVARRLGVSHVTVVQTVRRLQQAGLVTTQPYRSIFLTDDGRALARTSRHRHRVVTAFLAALGVPDPVARADAEGIEHHVSDATLAAFERFLARSEASTPTGPARRRRP
jgi:DtxR family manganese transport transcriptional regulator